MKKSALFLCLTGFLLTIYSCTLSTEDSLAKDISQKWIVEGTMYRMFNFDLTNGSGNVSYSHISEPVPVDYVLGTSENALTLYYRDEIWELLLINEGKLRLEKDNGNTYILVPYDEDEVQNYILGFLNRKWEWIPGGWTFGTIEFDLEKNGRGIYIVNDNDSKPNNEKTYSCEYTFSPGVIVLETKEDPTSSEITITYDYDISHPDMEYRGERHILF